MTYYVDLSTDSLTMSKQPKFDHSPRSAIIKYEFRFRVCFVSNQRVEKERVRETESQRVIDRKREL